MAVSECGNKPRRISPDLSSFIDKNTLEATSDVVVTVDERKFKCHTFILVKHSVWFYRTIKKLIAENDCGIIEIELMGISADIFQVIYNWMNTRDLAQLTSSDVKCVLQAAKQLQMPILIDECAKILPKNVTKSNAMQIYQNALENKNSFQILNSEIFLGKYFCEIVSSPQYLTYNVQQICDFLSLDNLKIQSETEVFEAALKWLRSNWGSRGRHTVKVLSTVRFALMTDEELLNIIFNRRFAAITQMMKIKQAILDAFHYHIAFENNILNEYPELIPRPRNYYCLTESSPDIPILKFSTSLSSLTSIMTARSKYSSMIPSRERKTSPESKRSPSESNVTPHERRSTSRESELKSYETRLSSAANKLRSSSLSRSNRSRLKSPTSCKTVDTSRKDSVSECESFVPRSPTPDYEESLRDIRKYLSPIEIPFECEYSCEENGDIFINSSPRIIQKAVMSPKKPLSSPESKDSSEISGALDFDNFIKCPITQFAKREAECTTTETEDDSILKLRIKDVLGRKACDKPFNPFDHCAINVKPIQTSDDGHGECKLSMTCKLAETKTSRLLGI